MIYIKEGGLWKEVSSKSLIPGSPMEGGYFAGVAGFSGSAFALIISDKSAETSLRWGDNGAIPSSASQSDGWANSFAVSGPAYRAIEYCKEYDGGGFNDWYLAAPDEWITMLMTLNPSAYFTQELAPDFSTGGSQAFQSTYWTSAWSTDSRYATRVSASSFSVTGTLRSFSTLVRPVRKVQI